MSEVGEMGEMGERGERGEWGILTLSQAASSYL